jgi:hypothetical protein
MRAKAPEYVYDKHRTRQQVEREIRDLYRKLMRTYRSHKVYAFFDREYHYSPERVDSIVCYGDALPTDVKQASTIYKIAMKDNYQL